jgi:diguanylate cyclase (GGDEF)-like protein
MAGCVRSTDFIARTGGEEFVIVLPHTDASGARSAAEKVLEAIRSLPGRAEVLSGKVTASIGVACCDGGACSAASLLESADRAMYRAKQGGRDRICAA